MTVTRHGRVIIISIHGIMHLLRVESVHARPAVALSTRRMRSNKIEFLLVEDEFKRKKMAQRQRNKTLVQVVVFSFVQERKQREKSHA